MSTENWDRRWIDLARLVASWSKDTSTKCGAVIVGPRNVLVSLGWNGFPRGIDDNVPERHHRPEKYLWSEHAERNAIYNAAATGAKTEGCRMYVTWHPCSDCARGIIQSGIRELICTKPDLSLPVWGENFRTASSILAEATIPVRYYCPSLPPIPSTSA